MICSSCHQDAPPIVRGLRVTCAACGALQPVTAAPDAVNLAGKPARIGGGVAKVLGALVLVLGLGLAVLVTLIFHAIFPAGMICWILGVLLGVPSLALGLSLLLGGHALSKSGEQSEQDAREHAMFALAGRRRGIVTAREAARALSLREEEADSLLTALAKRGDGRVTLEVDDNGGLHYAFHDILPQRIEVPKVRVGTSGSEPEAEDAEWVEKASRAARR